MSGEIAVREADLSTRWQSGEGVRVRVVGCGVRMEVPLIFTGEKSLAILTLLTEVTGHAGPRRCAKPGSKA